MLVTDFDNCRLPIIENFQAIKFDALPTISTTHLNNVQLLMVFNGYGIVPQHVEDYILQQYKKQVPIILFPYPGFPTTHKYSDALYAIHPLLPGLQEAVDPQKYGPEKQNLMVKKQPQHPILQNVKSLSSPSYHRSAQHAKAGTNVIATWVDGIPMIAECDRVVSLNFCLANYNISTNGGIVISNTIEYLLHKCYKKLKILRIHYTDVKFEF